MILIFDYSVYCSMLSVVVQKMLLLQNDELSEYLSIFEELVFDTKLYFFVRCKLCAYSNSVFFSLALSALVFII